jgi:hypothetical protein
MFMIPSGAFFMKGNVMFWVFLLFVILAAVFARLGAYSVWFAIFKGGLFLALVVIAGLAIALLWRQVFGQKTINQSRGDTCQISALRVALAVSRKNRCRPLSQAATIMPMNASNADLPMSRPVNQASNAQQRAAMRVTLRNAKPLAKALMMSCGRLAERPSS